MRRLFLTFTLIIFSLTVTNCDIFNEATATPTIEPDAPTASPTPDSPEQTPEPPQATDTPTHLPEVGSPDGPPTLTLPAPQIDEPAAIAHMPAGTTVIITYIDMKNETTGWAIGGENDPGDHILFTQDGGQTWRDVTPPEAAPTGGESAKIATAFFLDADNAWVTYSFEEFHVLPKYPIVWYTDNAGSSWQASAFLDTRTTVEFYSPSFMDFVDSQNGWLLVAVGAGMSHSYSLLFRTSDGGANWARIIDPQSGDGPHNCCKTGMTFADAQIGLLTQTQGPYVEPFVSWTRDGGLTWLYQPLPDPILAGCKTHSPHFFDSDAVLVGLSCWIYDDNDKKENYDFIYTSYDTGDTWMSSPADGSGDLFFFDEQHGFIFGRDIYSTSDGGLTWVLVKTVYWDGQFSFVNRAAGWVVARNDADENAFLSTTDGGETWLTIEPEIVEIE